MQETLSLFPPSVCVRAVPSIVFYVGKDSKNTETVAAHVYEGALVGDDVTEAIRRLATEDVKMLDDDNGDEILTEDRVPKVVLFRSQGKLTLALFVCVRARVCVCVCVCVWVCVCVSFARKASWPYTLHSAPCALRPTPYLLSLMPSSLGPPP